MTKTVVRRHHDAWRTSLPDRRSRRKFIPQKFADLKVASRNNGKLVSWP